MDLLSVMFKSLSVVGKDTYCISLRWSTTYNYKVMNGILSKIQCSIKQSLKTRYVLLHCFMCYSDKYMLLKSLAFFGSMFFRSSLRNCHSYGDICQWKAAISSFTRHSWKSSSDGSLVWHGRSVFKVIFHDPYYSHAVDDHLAVVCSRLKSIATRIWTPVFPHARLE